MVAPGSEVPHADLLDQRICDLGLHLEGSPLEASVAQLHRELEAKGLRHFRPAAYLTDEWGCPDMEPVIGIPFYLADPQLGRIERAMTDNLEGEREIMMYLRHEAGHAFNYSYLLYKTPRWREHFGPFFRRYRDDYRPVPFSRHYVRHIEGWYAQKHPDEDFAETFAIWLTPKSGWRKKYRGWPALAKLQYVDRVARRLRDTVPLMPAGTTDITADEMVETVREFYARWSRETGATVDEALGPDLTELFPIKRRRRGASAKPGVSRPAADFVEEHRALLTDRLAYWTGVRRPVVRALIERMARACRELDLQIEVEREEAAIVELTAYSTTLAMNFLTRGAFFQG
ncbi:MAG: putative zinc-binding metallopeptidase [Acidobacteriota bacterium]